MNIKVGNTPMVKIKYKYNGKEKFIYSKLETYNITGSIKDRVAYYIIKEAYREKKLKKGKNIVEATSGNTGISLSAIGAYFGNPVHIFMPDWVSIERVKIMNMYNAKVTLISRSQGGFKRALKEAENFSKENNAFYAKQFENKNNILAHYETTGEEILKQLEGNVDGFVSGIGTGGTLIGVAKRLKEANENVKIYALEPDKMPLLTQNKILGEHKIEGIGDDFIPEIVNKNRNLIDKTFTINDEDAINMSKKIAIELGLGVGISSGGNLIVSILANEEIDGNIVTVFPDDNKKYLTTELSNPIINNKEYISNNIELLDYDFI